MSLGLSFSAFSKASARLRELALLLERDREVVQGLGVLGIGLDGALEAEAGLLQSPFRATSMPKSI